MIEMRIVGALLLLLGISHAFFSRYFGWQQELAAVSLFTRRVFFRSPFFHRTGSDTGRRRIVSLCRCPPQIWRIEPRAARRNDIVLVLPFTGAVPGLRLSSLARRPFPYVYAHRVHRAVVLCNRDLRDRTYYHLEVKTAARACPCSRTG